MMKYIYEKDPGSAEHWKVCEERKHPYIVVSNLNGEFDNIFFDVTNYPMNLDKLSNKFKKMYSVYVEFFRLNHQVTIELNEQYYFFNLRVKKEHTNFIANNLFDYLAEQIKNRLD